MTQDQTPSLRFPEFRGAGAWAVKKLGEVCEINPSTKKLPEDFFYIDLGAVNSGNLISKKKLHCDSAPSRAQRLLKSGDIIYQVVRPYQRNNFLCNFDDKDNYVASTGYAQLRALDSNNFLYQLIHTDSFVNIVISKCKGSNYPAIGSLDLSEINISIPPLAEQQKIAEFLSSLDEVITIQGDRLDGLKDYKRGLMQQLFPADGQTTPTLRFREFQGKDPWQAKAGNEVFAQISNKEHDSNFPILAITQEHGAIPRDAIDYHVSVSEKSIANYKVVEIADFIISLRSFQGGIEYSNYKGLCSPAYVILRKKKDECEDYFKYFFKTERFIKDLNKNIEGLRDGKMISYKQFSELFLPIPPLAEQQKIAECLSAMDDLITVQKQKIKDLNNHKNGLMQQLFPKL